MKTWTAALVVEDDALVRFELAQTLEAEGYKTFEAGDAAEAIAVLEANSEIRVVFTDIQMPGNAFFRSLPSRPTILQRYAKATAFSTGCSCVGR